MNNSLDKETMKRSIIPGLILATLMGLMGLVIIGLSIFTANDVSKDAYFTFAYIMFSFGIIMGIATMLKYRKIHSR